MNRSNDYTHMHMLYTCTCIRIFVVVLLSLLCNTYMYIIDYADADAMLLCRRNHHFFD